MAFPFPPDNNQPIPNDPFYYPDTNYIKGEYGPFIVGSGFIINNATGTIEVSGGGSGAPTILAGPGILVTAGTGTVTITNSGIRTVTAGAGIAVSVSAGNLNITNTAPAPGVTGTVTQVNTGTGLTGGPITTTGTLSLAPVTTVSPGTYSNPTITVDAYGRVTYAAPGSGALGSLIQATAPLTVNASIPQTISINPASTAAPGAVQLNTSTSSTSTTQAATPSAVKQAFDLATTAAGDASFALSTANTAAVSAAAAQTTANNALATATSAQSSAVTAQTTANTALTNAAAAQTTANAAIPRASFTAKGQVLAATGSGTFGTVGPGTNGQILVACATCAAGVAWVTQPVASGTVTSVSTGPGLIGGPITTTGTISLATTGVTPNTYTYANVAVDAYGRVTAAGNGVPPIPCACITGKGAIVTGTAANAPVALPVGLDNRVLTACAACPEGLTWSLPASAGIPCSCITGKGALISGSAPGTVTSVAVGTNGYVLTADSSAASGLTWAPAAAAITSATPTVEGSVFASTDNAAPFATALGFNALNTTVTGLGNVAIGTCSGCSLSSGQFNTYVGSGAGTVSTTGSNNIAVGSQALSAQTTGACNIAIGNLAGLNLTTECNNVIIGPAPGEVGCNNNVFIASGSGAVRLRFNENGAFGIAGTAYGTSGQVLMSAGPGAAPAWTSISGGSVTAVTAGTGLTGGTITTTGTIDLANTTVSPGSYTYGSFTVDPQGRLTAASSGTAPVTLVTGTAPIAVTAGTTPVVSIAAASTTGTGAVQLYNNVDSTSTTLALTAAQGKNLQDQITALSVAGTVELAGTIDASVGGIILSVTSVGTSDGYVVGNTLPAASATTNNTYVIVTTPGTMTPPGGSPTVATRGDWFLVSETSPGVYAWTFLNVGFDVSYATTTSSGVVCLSTNALAQAGTDTTTALTPATAASAYIPKTCITAKGDLVTGTSANTPVSLGVGTDGQILIACAACSTGLTWGPVTVSQALPETRGTVYGFVGSGLSGSVGLGYDALNGVAANNTGNVAIGARALCAQTSTLSNNVAIGNRALCSDTNSQGNTVVGGSAMVSAQNSLYNVAVGSGSLFYGGAGANTLISNVVVGYSAGGSLGCTGPACQNILIGQGAGNLTAGNQNVAIGPGASLASPTGSCQLAIGFNSTCNWLTGDSTKAIKPGAGIIDCAGSCGTAGQVLISTGANSICWTTVSATAATPTTFGTVTGCTTSGIAALGCNALGGNAFGPACGHVAIGTCALYSTNSTSYNNVAIGVCSQALTTSGNSNVAIGFCSLALNTTGSGNVAIGDRALSKNTTSGTNTAVGWLALGCFTGTSVSTNDAFGANALPSFICGDYNVSIGGWSLFNAICGTLNTAVGHRALTGVTCANINTAIGFYAGQNITTGCSNVAIGSCTFVANPAGSCQLVIGWAPTCNWLTGDSNKNIRPGNGIIDCIGSVGTACQVLRTTGTGALQWSSVGASASGIVNALVGVCLDNLQVFMSGAAPRSFLVKVNSGTEVASWTSTGALAGGYATATLCQSCTLTTTSQYFASAYNFPGHGSTQCVTLCYGSPPTAAYQIIGIVGLGYNNNIISITRIA